MQSPLHGFVGAPTHASIGVAIFSMDVGNAAVAITLNETDHLSPRYIVLSGQAHPTPVPREPRGPNCGVLLHGPGSGGLVGKREQTALYCGLPVSIWK